MKKDFFIISYDICDNKRRRKLVKHMERNGVRVQKSVFECLWDEKKFIKLRRKIEEIIDMKQDSVRYYILCARCVERIKVSGSGTVLEEQKEIVV